MISFLAIFAYLPRADDPANVAAPGVDDEVIVVVHVPERANPNLAVVTPAVFGFDDGVLEDQGSVSEIDTVLVEISPPLFLVPFEADKLRYTFVYTASSPRITPTHEFGAGFAQARLEERAATENTWLILRLGDRHIVRKALRVRLWTRRQWEHRLRAAGMRLVRAYADLSGTPYRKASGRLIVLAEKR